ncbi:hypothetical protein F5X99DRAFT_377070 [Biscogniauxia marginata]|nr:hypothetical protein F5X99DRAFT_377070 [Biscogniauxia marginata]
MGMAIHNGLERYKYHRAQYPYTQRFKSDSKDAESCGQKQAHQQIQVSFSSKVQWLASQLSHQTRQKYQQPYSRPMAKFPLESLPKNVIDRICLYVPYEQLLHLSMGSRILLSIVDPYLAPFDTMMSLVLRAERDFAKHVLKEGGGSSQRREKAPYNLGCYVCYRVLPPERFASNQPPKVIVQDDDTGCQSIICLRRYCINCGLRVGYHGPGDYLERPTGERSWICNCGNVIDWNETSNCEVCRAVCPFRSMAAVRSDARRAYGEVNTLGSQLKIISSLRFRELARFRKF